MRHPHLKKLLLAGITRLAFCGDVALAHTEDKGAVVMHAPNEVIGEGAYSVRRAIFDPVTRQPWAFKPYHLIIRSGNEIAANYEGIADAQGRTLTLRFADAIADENVYAFPVIGTGRYQAHFTLVDAARRRARYQVYLFSFSGRVFVGLSDSQGNTAEMRMDSAQKADVIGLQRPPAWRKEAAILNQTIGAETPEERIALLEQVRASGKSTIEHALQTQDYYSSKPITSLLDVEFANARLAPDALAQVGERIIQSANPANGAERLNAVVGLLKRVQDAGIAAPDIFTRQATTLALALRPPEWNDKSLDSLMFVSQFWLKQHEAGTPEQIMRANGLDESLAETGSSPDRNVRQLAALSDIAWLRGDVGKAENLFALANLLQAKYRIRHAGDGHADAPDGEPDALADLRGRYPKIKPGNMLVSADAIAELRVQCVFSAFPNLPVFGVGKQSGATEGEMKSIRLLPMVPALDAMLAHGVLKPGRYKRANSCDGQTENPVKVSANDLKLLRHFFIDGMTLFLELEDHEAKEMLGDLVNAPNARTMPPEAGAHLIDILSVFLEHAQLSAGQYRMSENQFNFN